ncbi:MAG: hypothetical protein ACREJQ_04070, partial [bacterium]
MNRQNRKLLVFLLAVAFSLTNCGLSLFGKKSRAIDGFRHDLKPGQYALYLVTTTGGNVSHADSVRSAVLSISVDPDSREKLIWIEHDFIPQSGVEDLSVRKVKFLTTLKSWQAYLEDPSKNPLNIREIDSQVEKEPVSKYTKPEDIKIISTNFGPGFAVVKDFAQAVQKKADKPESVKVKTGEYNATRYDFE